MPSAARLAGKESHATRPGRLLIPAFAQLVMGLAAAAVVPAQALPTVSRYYSAQVYGTREGIGGGAFGGIVDSGNLPASSSLQGGDWTVGAIADDTRGGTVTAGAFLTVPIAQPTFISKLTAESILRYIFTLDGPDPNASIPVLFSAAGSAQVSPGSGAAAISLYFDHDGETLRQFASIGFGPAPWTAEIGANELVYLHAGHTYSLTISASAQTNVHDGNVGDTFAQATAAVDPTFAIQAAYADDYHFVGLPDSSIVAPSVAAVPEPATWSLMMAGVCLLGEVARRGRRGQSGVSRLE